ncbi:hypothetical protein HGRIS_002125 [Hohenbuehelia grisea]|uniref:Uncharacterized protein n=1 Tax=Hohenbuehelia grisea TaxID=104357 RepID=A0ABR3JJJ6_9AGAR
MQPGWLGAIAPPPPDTDNPPAPPPNHRPRPFASSGPKATTSKAAGNPHPYNGKNHT